MAACRRKTCAGACVACSHVGSVGVSLRWGAKFERGRGFLKFCEMPNHVVKDS